MPAEEFPLVQAKYLFISLRVYMPSRTTRKMSWPVRVALMPVLQVKTKAGHLFKNIILFFVFVCRLIQVHTKFIVFTHML